MAQFFPPRRAADLPTAPQLELMLALQDYTDRQGQQPTYQQLGDMLGITRNAVHLRMMGLRDRGFVALTGQPGAVRILKRIQYGEV